MTQIKQDPRVHRKAIPEVKAPKKEEADAKETAPKAAPKRKAAGSKG